MSYRVANIPLPLAAAHFSPTPHLAGSQHPICNNEGNGQLGSFPLTNLVVLQAFSPVCLRLIRILSCYCYVQSYCYYRQPSCVQWRVRGDVPFVFPCNTETEDSYRKFSGLQIVAILKANLNCMQTTVWQELMWPFGHHVICKDVTYSQVI